MKYCKKCVMPNTRPGIVFTDAGVCAACVAAEKKKEINWKKRREELETLCAKHRGRRGNYYDCIIAVSGGKDSHFQTYMMKEEMKMNPLLVTVDNFTWTETGRHNIKNISEAFGCDILALSLNRKIAKSLIRKGFEKLGMPTQYWDLAVYVYPIQMAIKLDIPLIVYGENINYEYGGSQTKETYSAKNQINNDVVRANNLDFYVGEGVTLKDLNFCEYPSSQEIEKTGVEPIYLSYFVPWDGYHNYQIAKQYGFRDLSHEWKREGFIEDYDQVDAIDYLVDAWFKYPKYGHARATDVASNWIRAGRISREEGVKLVKEHDHKLDQKSLQSFLDCLGYTHKEFWDIVEKYWNRDIFDKINGAWKMKKEIVGRLECP